MTEPGLAMRPRRSHGILESPWIGYPLMVAVEIYARVRGVYRTKYPPHIHDYPLIHWPPPLGPNHPIVAFGDSMTEGTGAGRGQSYPDHLASLLGLPVVNAGKSGDTTEDALARVHKDVLTKQPGMVLLCLGGNDLLQRIPPEQTIENLRRIVAIIQNAGYPVMILGLRGSWLLGMDHDGPTRQLARETGCPLVPLILDNIWGVPWRMAEHVHPNARGYREVARRIAADLQALPGIAPLTSGQNPLPTHDPQE